MPFVIKTAFALFLKGVFKMKTPFALFLKGVANNELPDWAKTPAALGVQVLSEETLLPLVVCPHHAMPLPCHCNTIHGCLSHDVTTPCPKADFAPDKDRGNYFRVLNLFFWSPFWFSNLHNRTFFLALALLAIYKPLHQALHLLTI